MNGFGSIEFFSNVLSNFNTFRVADVLDVLIVAFVVYQLIMLVRKTRVGQLAKGALIFLLIYAFANYFKVRTVKWILNSVLQVGLLALVIIFQPELRRALEQVGHTEMWIGQLFQSNRYDPSVRGKWQAATVAICDAAEQLSMTRTGALMVLERNTNLSEIIRTGTALNADVNPEMLGTIFYEGTPLHDGAVVVRDGQLIAAGCVLPLSNNLGIGKDMGTRHRAALGMSENSDAVVVVVSEETGIISLAKNGVLIRRLDRQNLFDMLQKDVVPAPETEQEEKPALKRLRAFWRNKDEEK